MANILLLGNADSITAFSRSIRGDHSINRMIIPLEAVEHEEELVEIPEPADNLDAIFDLTWGLPVGKLQSLDVAARMRSEHTLLFTNVLTGTATAARAWLGIELPVIGFAFAAGIVDVLDTIEVSSALQNDPEAIEAASSLLSGLTQKRIEVVEDRVALVSPRVLSMIINEASFALAEGVASAEDIDTAMRLGTNYPRGPLAWSDVIGAGTVVAILDALFEEYHEERYRASTLLRQHARASRPFYPTP